METETETHRADPLETLVEPVAYGLFCDLLLYDVLELLAS